MRKVLTISWVENTFTKIQKPLIQGVATVCIFYYQLHTGSYSFNGVVIQYPTFEVLLQNTRL